MKKQTIKRTLTVMGLLSVAILIPLGWHFSFARAAKPPPQPPPAPAMTNTLAAPPPTAGVAGPSNKTWYIAQGRVGAGFREYLTIENSSSVPCSVDILYYPTSDGSTTPSPTKTVLVSVPATSRLTQSVNSDFAVPDTAPTATNVGAALTIDKATPNCPGVVVERPLYFVKYQGVSSGVDVLGANALAPQYLFADVASGSGITTSLVFLNPGAAAANVTARYFSNGKQVATQTLTVPANARAALDPGTVNPALPSHVVAQVTSNHPIVAERFSVFSNPSVFSNINGFSGASDVIGTTQANATDWFFAEGYTGLGAQEYLTIGNMGAAPAVVAITLKSQTGAIQTFAVTVPAMSQTIWNVNGNNTFSGSTPEVSAEVKSSKTAIVVQRQIYYHYHHILNNTTLQTMSTTDVLGVVGPVVKTAYSFAEGYTNTGYNEWLTLQNPTANAETIAITLFNNKGQSTTQSISVPANSRATVDITAMVQQHLAQPGDIPGNEVSMTVQTSVKGAVFVAERPLYFNTAGTSFPVQGGTDIIGYA